MWRTLVVLAFGVSCAPRVVELSAPRSPDSLAEPGPLHVIPVLDGAPDSLTLPGRSVVLGGVAQALADTVHAACSPWATSHRAARPSGWEMRLALEQASATSDGTDLTVELAARITLSAAEGQRYLAQTRAYCRQKSRPGAPPAGAVDTCMASLAHDIAGWLEGVAP